MSVEGGMRGKFTSFVPSPRTGYHRANRCTDSSWACRVTALRTMSMEMGSTTSAPTCGRAQDNRINETESGKLPATASGAQVNLRESRLNEDGERGLLLGAARGDILDVIKPNVQRRWRTMKPPERFSVNLQL
ncbi:hypothetical protein LCGC14_1269440 [marine sediment metagenome]|uniref:Uncharacterized protein n=1 Tax=marine sediment metagenome TaxID=412755 RepID=A0A0F9P1P2_9ZZZZ